MNNVIHVLLSVMSNLIASSTEAKMDGLYKTFYDAHYIRLSIEKWATHN